MFTKITRAFFRSQDNACPSSARSRRLPPNPIAIRIALVLSALLSGWYVLASGFKADVMMCQFTLCPEEMHYFIDAPHSILDGEYKFLPHAHRAIASNMGVVFLYVLFCGTLLFMRVRDASMISVSCLMVASLGAVIDMFSDIFLSIWLPYSLLVGCVAALTLCYSLFFIRDMAFSLRNRAHAGRNWIESGAALLGLLFLACIIFGEGIVGLTFFSS